MKPRKTVEAFPLSRLGTFDVGVIENRKHQIVGLLEADVTEARASLRALRRQGAAASLTAWVIKTVAATVAQAAQVQGMRKGRRRSAIEFCPETSYT